MIWILLSKLTGTGLGLLMFRLSPSSPILVAAVSGIAPIWLEVLATRLTGVEPSLELRPGWLRLDACVDALSFVLVPPLLLSCTLARLASDAVPSLLHSASTLSSALSALVFVGCGFFRLLRFLKTGVRRLPGEKAFFEGLPVTYTGYLWLGIALAFRWNFEFLAPLFLLSASAAMVSTRLRIPTSGKVKQ